MTGGLSVLRIEGPKHSNLETGAPMSEKPISPLRQRMHEYMKLRGFNPDTQRDYIRAVKKLAAFLDRSPDTATVEDLRAFQLHLTAIGVQPPTISVSSWTWLYLQTSRRARPIRRSRSRTLAPAAVVA